MNENKQLNSRVTQPFCTFVLYEGATRGPDCKQWEKKDSIVFCFFFFLQNNASKLLLAIMESRHDSETAERILYNMRPKELVCMSACTCSATLI